MRLLGSAILVAVAVAALSALRVVVAWLADQPARTGRRPVPRLILALPRLLLILAALWFLIAGVWGVDLSAALTALGVTSLVISFALQDTLSGIASGFTLLADQPFSPGDWIESDDVEGRVIDVNWRATRIRNRDGDLIVIPNGQLANATITNYDQPSAPASREGARADRTDCAADCRDRDADRRGAVDTRGASPTRRHSRG